MAHQHLVLQHLFITPGVHQPENVEACRAANGVRDLALRHFHRLFGKQGGQLLHSAPAQVTTFQGILATRVGNGQSLEVCALTQLCR